MTQHQAASAAQAPATSAADGGGAPDPHHHDHDHVGKGHDHVREGLSLGSETGRISLQIVATLLGGVLLVCALLATVLFPGQVHADILAFIAAVLLGAPLVWVAIKDLLHGHTHMNELVALAVLAAFAIGEYKEAAVIAFLMIISVLIENRTALGAQASIESLIRITPTRARKVKAAPGNDRPPESADAASDDEEEEVEAASLQPGDVVRVRPGDNIPSDGVVLRGASTVNQATITGESVPADKNDGAEVFGGTINLTGVMDIRVTKAGEDTTLGRVKSLILQAESTRIPIMRAIDRYAVWYTPTILMIVAIVLFFAYTAGVDDPWHRAIAMLVIACPCALILATPTAMVAALSAAARLGVLVKSVVDLEAARNLTAIVFDKTGTLTTGELEVTRLAPAPDVEPVELLSAAATAERSSRHPVARALVDVGRKARLKLPEPEQFNEVAGRGVEATVHKERILVGRPDWVLETHGGLDETARVFIEQAQQHPDTEGLSVLFVVKGNKVLGWVGLADNTRADAAEAMDTLRKDGIKRLVIVTGDRESVARRVAGQMNTEYRAEVLPQQKLELVDELKRSGHHVAVIGDGVNDAPALAAGDISIAMGAAGSDVAIHSAKIALMNNNLNRIPFLVELSRKTSRVVMQNLIFAVLFILVFGSLAALGIVTPMVAAVLHVASSLVVIFNSARLVRAGELIEEAEARARDRVSRERTGRGESADAPAQPLAPTPGVAPA